MLLNQIHVGDFFWRCHVLVYVVMEVVVTSGSSPSAYIRGLIFRIDRGDPNEQGLVTKVVYHCANRMLQRIISR